MTGSNSNENTGIGSAEVNSGCELAFGTDFFYNLSSRLKDPLSAIQTSIQLLKKYSDNKICDFAHETFTLMECSIEDISEFSENLDLLSQPAGFKIRRNAKRVILRSLIKQVIEEIKFQNLDHTRITVTYSDDKSPVFLDKYLLGKVIVNLLSNALKFSRDVVFLSVKVEDCELILQVTDSGIGIPENQIHTVFNPFVRAGNAGMISGIGLGLALVTRAIEYFNGKISLKSEINQGTKIEVSIPSFKMRKPARIEKNQILLSHKIQSHD